MNRVDGQRQREGAKARKRRKKAFSESSWRRVTGLPKGRVETGDEIEKVARQTLGERIGIQCSKLTAEMAAGPSRDPLPYALSPFAYGRSERTMAVLGMHRTSAFKYRATRSDRDFSPERLTKTG